MTRAPMRCGELLKRICDIFETQANKNLQAQAIDITHSQIKMLVNLDQSNDGSATLKELEKYFGLSQATTAGIAARLEKKGLIQGYMDAEDRRVKHVRLSNDGRELCRRARSFMDSSEKWLLEALNEKDQKELQRLLQKIYENIQ